MPLEPIEVSRITQGTANPRTIIGMPENEKKLRKMAHSIKDNEDPQQSVKVSASLMIKSSSSSDIDFAKIETIKNAIQNGELKMDTDKIADFLIQELKSMI